MSTMNSQTFTTEPMVWSSRNFLKKFLIPLPPGRGVVDDFLGVQYLLIFDDDEAEEEGVGRCWTSAIFLSLTARSSIGITTPAASLALLPPIETEPEPDAEDDEEEEEENQLNDGKPGKRDSIHRCQ